MTCILAEVRWARAFVRAEAQRQRVREFLERRASKENTPLPNGLLPMGPSANGGVCLFVPSAWSFRVPKKRHSPNASLLECIARDL